MKKITQAIIFILISFSFFSCSFLLAKKRNFEFVKSVGGISIEEPILTYDGWYLPVKCNVSGTETITNIPTTVNSGIECSKIQISKNDTAIFDMFHI